MTARDPKRTLDPGPEFWFFADNYKGFRVFGWFKKRESPTFVDPILGKLVLQNRAWSGEFEFGADRRSVHLLVEDQNGKPSSGAANFVQELEQRFQLLSGPISDELRRLFQPWYEEFWDETRPLPEANELIAMFELTAIDYYGKEKSLLEFALKERWDDGRFRISLEEWIPTGIGVED